MPAIRPCAGAGRIFVGAGHARDRMRAWCTAKIQSRRSCGYRCCRGPGLCGTAAGGRVRQATRHHRLRPRRAEDRELPQRRRPHRRGGVGGPEGRDAAGIHQRPGAPEGRADDRGGRAHADRPGAPPGPHHPRKRLAPDRRQPLPGHGGGLRIDGLSRLHRGSLRAHPRKGLGHALARPAGRRSQPTTATASTSATRPSASTPATRCTASRPS